MIGVKIPCRLDSEANCTDIISEESFNSPVTGEKHRNAKFHVSIIPRTADLEFAVSFRGKELGRVQADYAENLRDTELEGKGISVA